MRLDRPGILCNSTSPLLGTSSMIHCSTITTCHLLIYISLISFFCTCYAHVQLAHVQLAHVQLAPQAGVLKAANRAPLSEYPSSSITSRPQQPFPDGVQYLPYCHPRTFRRCA